MRTMSARSSAARAAPRPLSGPIIGALAGDQDVRVDFVDVDRLARRGSGGRRR
jgi:hypothetical protein